MPGRLVAHHDMANHDTGDRKDLTAAHEKTVSSGPQPMRSDGAALQDGLETTGKVAGADPLANGVIDTADRRRQRLLDALPPEIAQITANFQPLSKLFPRAAQECYNNLTDMLAALSDQRDQQVNGDLPSHVAASQMTKLSNERRLQWLDFANMQRERFIKLLVLLQWSRQVDDVSKIIDIFAWLREREAMYEQVDDMMGSLKREMHYERIASPDLETALEILSSGQSSRMPDLDYLPKDPLPASKLLKTLRTVNTLLHIRLNLHETLPPHFRTFRVRSGRATFVVPGEFEVDLSIADEDPASQFWFLEFRFLFNPRSEIPAGRLRNQLEGKANEVLASHGLSGCYDFFHDFVLTYKINILRRQALELNRTSWAGQLRIEQVHRSLITQYWLDRSGNKNWIEIGVFTGNGRKSLRSQNSSRLGLKWVRAGKETEGPALSDTDVEDINISRVLQSVVTYHTKQLLSSIRDRLKIAGIDAALECISDKQMHRLNILTCFSKSSEICIEPVNGRIALLPVTGISGRYEEKLNSLQEDSEQAASILMAYKVAEISAMLQEGARRVNWVTLANPEVKVPAWRNALASAPGDNAARINMYKPWTTSSWSVAVLISPSREPSWWIVHDHPPASGETDGVSSVEFLTTLDAANVSLEPGYFRQLEDLAITFIAVQVNTTHLTRLSIPCAVHRPADLETLSVHTMPFILIKVSALLGDQTAAMIFTGDQVVMRHCYSSTWQNNELRFKYVVRGRMFDSGDFLRHLTKWRDPHTRFAEDGTFSLHIHTTLSAPDVIDQVRVRLSALLRLRTYMEIVRRRQFRCVAATINSLKFIYAHIKLKDEGELSKSSPPAITMDLRGELQSGMVELSVEVGFIDDPMDIAFQPLTRNPHNHVRAFLLQLLNKSSRSMVQAKTVASFAAFTRALDVTLPVIQALTLLSSNTYIHVRNLGDYQLEFIRPRCAFTIRCFNAHEPPRPDLVCMWCIEEVSLPRLQPKGSSSMNGKLKDAMTEFWKSESAKGLKDGITGLGRGISCSLEHVAGIIDRLSAVVSACEDGELPDEEEEVISDQAADEKHSVPDPERKKGTSPNGTEADKSPLVGLGLNMGKEALNGPVPPVSALQPSSRPMVDGVGSSNVSVGNKQQQGSNKNGSVANTGSGIKSNAGVATKSGGPMGGGNSATTQMKQVKTKTNGPEVITLD